MSGHRFSATALAVVMSLTFATAPAMANPGNGQGNGQGNGNGGGQGNGQGNSGNHGNANAGNHGNKQNNAHQYSGKSNKSVSDDVDVRVSFDRARHLALNYGLTGYDSLPPGIAKNLARGKPLPPGIAKKTVPASMLGQLPSYPGYEWRVVGDDLVLIALSTAIVTTIINGVFK
ncbi:anti-virulence regulator CigR family protein [Lelliottia amnigena]|uniref:anti-virulence regulator CigR family protein n=1 Tax=Lelliottia amnigena TaxID=61646 RepID=UPI0019598230|nr:anti-virulence regulator CigR family protein [Lelliottia amnigena]MBM7356819.1 Ni/Co efflux regulator RcnB [Lelliottia amnigena]WSO19082.1 anti-virulence regulator CigR family protein [Lelliottia amnigena]